MIAAIILFLTPAISIFSSLAIAPISAMLAVLHIRQIKHQIFIKPVFLIFIGYIFISATYSIADDAYIWCLKILSIYIIGMTLSYAPNAFNDKALWLSLLLTLIIFLVEIFFHGAIYHLITGKIFVDYYLNRSATFLVVLFFAAITTINARVFLMLILLLIAVFLSESLSAKIGVLVAIAAFFMTRYWPKFTIQSTKIMVILLAISFPLISFYMADILQLQFIKLLPDSALHRLYIWQNTIHLIIENPIFGYGIAGSRNFQHYGMVMENGWNLLPMHPHNNFMQLLLELGVIGLALYLLVVINIIEYVAKTEDNIIKAKYMAIFAAYFAISLFAYNIWQEWWLLVPFITIFASKIGKKNANN